MRRIWMMCLLAACGGKPPAEKPGPAPGKANVPVITAYVHGPLAEADLAKARAAHDSFAGGARAAAEAAGDLGHHVMLGTGEPSPDDKDRFLALDEWVSIDGPRAAYGDPNFQAGFKPLFAAPVAPELYQRRPDWVTWGDLKPPPGGGPYWVMIVKGHLAKATEEENRKAHDAVAGGFKAIAMKSGDIAHVPHVSVDDPRVFFNVDVSTSHEGMIAGLTNPDFQKAFGALFDAPPEVHIYRATDWEQW